MIGVHAPLNPGEARLRLRGFASDARNVGGYRDLTELIHEGYDLPLAMASLFHAHGEPVAAQEVSRGPGDRFSVLRVCGVLSGNWAHTPVDGFEAITTVNISQEMFRLPGQRRRKLLRGARLRVGDNRFDSVSEGGDYKKLSEYDSRPFDALAAMVPRAAQAGADIATLKRTEKGYWQEAEDHDLAAQVAATHLSKLSRALLRST